MVEPVTRSVPGRELRRTLARGDEQRGREQRRDEGRDPVGSHGRSCYVQNDRRRPQGHRPARTLARMKVRVDPDLCVGHGRCYVLAPEVFEPDDFGHCVVLVAEVDGAAAEQARVPVPRTAPSARSRSSSRRDPMDVLGYRASA